MNSQLTPPAPRYRRVAGLLLGALLGAVFGVVSQYINRLALPGVPLYQPPWGPLGNSLLAALTGAGLGVIAAWPASGVHGTAIASAVSAVIIVGGSLIQARPTGEAAAAAVALTGVMIVLPFWGLLVPLLAALRWGAGQQEEDYRDRRPAAIRLRSVAMLVLLVGLAAALALYPAERRVMLRATHDLLQAVRQGSLPDSLRTPAAGPVSAHLAQPYTLAWEREDIERYRIPRPGRNFDLHAVVVARFADGWNLVCLYVVADEPPICHGFDRLPE